jgi:hypothetical protein
MIQNTLESSSKQLFVAVTYMNVGVRQNIFVENQVLFLAITLMWADISGVESNLFS